MLWNIVNLHLTYRNLIFLRYVFLCSSFNIEHFVTFIVHCTGCLQPLLTCRLLDRVVSQVGRLSGGNVSCDLWHRRKVASLSVFFKIDSLVDHPVRCLFPAQYVLRRPTRVHAPTKQPRQPFLSQSAMRGSHELACNGVRLTSQLKWRKASQPARFIPYNECAMLSQFFAATRVALAGHSRSFEMPRYGTVQFSRSFVLSCVRLWNGLHESVFAGEGVGAFKTKVNRFLLQGWLPAVSSFSSTISLLFFIFPGPKIA